MDSHVVLRSIRSVQADRTIIRDGLWSPQVFVRPKCLRGAVADFGRSRPPGHAVKDCEQGTHWQDIIQEISGNAIQSQRTCDAQPANVLDMVENVSSLRPFENVVRRTIAIGCGAAACDSLGCKPEERCPTNVQSSGGATYMIGEVPHESSNSHCSQHVSTSPHSGFWPRG